jgi:serine protease
VIVKYKADAASARKTIQAASTTPTATLLANRAQSLGTRLGVALSAGNGISARSHVVSANGLSSDELAQRIARDADVEYAAPDRMRRRFAVPNDPFYVTRPYNDPSTADRRRPAGRPVVPEAARPRRIDRLADRYRAGLDQRRGRVGHHDRQRVDRRCGARYRHALRPRRFPHRRRRRQPAARLRLPQRRPQFRRRPARPRRRCLRSGRCGDAGRRRQPRAGCTPDQIGTSSWHGTETAGLIGATTNNAVGIASVGRNVRVLPVRVLGKCGGYDSDIVAGMLWAAGISVPGVPDNPNARGSST